MLTLLLGAIVVGLGLAVYQLQRALRRQQARIRCYREIMRDYQARAYAAQRGGK